MKPLMLALGLLAFLSCDQQTEAFRKNDTTHQQNGNAGSSVVITENNKKQPDSHAAPTREHQGDTETTARPAVSSQCVVDYLWGRFKTLKAADKIALLLLIVTALYLFATVMIWRQMVKSNKHAETAYEGGKKDSAEGLRLTRESNEQTKRSVEIADKQAAVQERSLELQNRAWLVCTGIEHEPTSEETPFIVRAVIKNVGRGAPATNTRSVLAVAIRDTPTLTAENWNIAPSQSASVSIVGAGSEIKLSSLTKFSQEKLGPVEDGTRHLFAFGIVTYDDIFKTGRELTFSARYIPGLRNWAIGPDGNKIT